MSDHALARLGAPQRAANHLSDLADAAVGRLDSVSRSGTIVALSAGLVAAVGLPAKSLNDGASTAAPAAGASAPQLADTIAVGAASPLQVRRAPAAGLGGNPLAAPGTFSASGTPLTAPVAARVSFEAGTVTAIPKPPVVVQRRSAGAAPADKVVQRRGDESTVSRASRSAQRPSLAKRAPAAGSAAKSAGASVGGSSALAIAARYVGTPYRFGGTTPAGFDCSGFTRYVYKQLGYSLPRTANQQLDATRRVSVSAARPGDLVFFVSRGRAYHNGIYAGNGKMYDAPRSGKRLQKRAIWDATVVFGRVTR